MNIIGVISIIVSIPVVATSYYLLILTTASFFYPNHVGKRAGENPRIRPTISIIIAAYNERFVIGRSLDALKKLDYPKTLVQVLIADDSSDDTRQIIDQHAAELRNLGFNIQVSRRTSREGFKAGALRSIAPLIKGDYVLLLDADSMVTSEILTMALPLFNSRSDIAFVSYRVGHYNRDKNLVTRLYALMLDLGDVQLKMGGTVLNTPFSYFGAATIISRRVLEEVDFWREGSITEDMDISTRIYSSGHRGVYLTGAMILTEDPDTLEVWKRQSARVVQGWGRVIRENSRGIIGTNKLSRLDRLGLFLILLTPLSALSWILLTFLNASAIVLGLSSTENSIFSSPAYGIFISLPAAAFFVAAIRSLQIQKIMNWKNLLLVPLLAYSGSGLMTAISLGYVKGLLGRTGSIFRTPKAGGMESSRNSYLADLTWDRETLLELTISLTGLILAVAVSIREVYFLGLSMIGFSLLTLKSANLTRLFRRKMIVQTGEARVELPTVQG